MTLLWTIQSEQYWRESRERGMLIGNPDPPGNGLDFGVMYRWMVDQMAIRMYGFSGNHPVWAWPAKVPFYESDGWGMKGDRMVRLTLDIPDQRILLSDFHAWNGMLMGDGIIDPEENPNPSVKGIKDSWVRVFDLSLSEYFSTGLLQACVDGVAVEEVIDEYYFTM